MSTTRLALCMLAAIGGAMITEASLIFHPSKLILTLGLILGIAAILLLLFGEEEDEKKMPLSGALVLWITVSGILAFILWVDIAAPIPLH